MFRRHRTDWTPTFGISITAITIYLVYTSLRLDKLIREDVADKADQKRGDQEAARDREDIRAKSDKRDRQITIVIGVMSLILVALTIKWASL